jgi:hypothetical protein
MRRIKKEFLQRMISHINRKAWWHVPPLDPEAYHKRGKFLASSFAEAEFYGRPLDEPERPKVANPLVGSERAVCRVLFGEFIRFPKDDEDNLMEKRFALDVRIKDAALAQGYDSIVIMHPKCYTQFKRTGNIPRMLELNILNPGPPFGVGRHQSTR